MAVMKPGDKVMFQGEEVAALAAATEDQADDALRLIKVQYEVLPHIATSALATARRRAAGVQGRQRQGRRHRRGRRSRGRLQGGRARRRGQLRHAGADARVARDARLRLRVGGRQADRVGLDAGRARHARGVREGPRHPAGQRPRDHRVHGRRLRQQVRAGRAGHHLREAREAGRRRRASCCSIARRSTWPPATGPRRRRRSRPASAPTAC